LLITSNPSFQVSIDEMKRRLGQGIDIHLALPSLFDGGVNLDKGGAELTND